MLTPDDSNLEFSSARLPRSRAALAPRIETICDADVGGEALVYLQLRNVFPGPGGSITTEQDIATAFRVPNGRPALEMIESDNITYDLQEDRNQASLRFFLKHVILKKLDDFFFRSGVYGYAHIPRPLGCTSDGACLYEWVYGNEGAPYDYIDSEFNRHPLHFDEQFTAFGAFRQCGIDISRDISDQDRGMIKNIIIEESGLGSNPQKVSCLWKRIDFGPRSIGFNLELLEHFLDENSSRLVTHLGAERFEMIVLATRYLSASDNMTEQEHARLFDLLGDYRISTTRHMGVEAISPLDRSLIPEILVLNPNDELKHEAPTVIRPTRVNSDSSLVYEIRREFPCFDGTIFTHQHIAVARITRDSEPACDFGLRLFLRHFLLKKLENAFISMGRYSFAHLARPLGSESRSYLYEWVEGDARCPREFVDRSSDVEAATLADWDNFVESFRLAGVEMADNLRWVVAPYGSDGSTAKQIILRQPQAGSEKNLTSRLWARVNCHDKSIPIDYEKLKSFLVDNAVVMRANLTVGRYETMNHALDYLTNALKDSRYNDLRRGIQAYRVSALQHLNYRGFSR